VTKRWSSTRSDLLATKRQASKDARAESKFWTQEELDEAKSEAAELAAYFAKGESTQ
jgi:hypothetical protein